MNPAQFLAAIRSYLSRLASLDAVDWRVLIAALFLLPLIAISLRIFDYPRTRGFMERSSIKNARAAEPEIEIARVTRLVGVAARHGVYRANCLRQALAVWWLLARRGITTELRFGVQKDHNGFSAHAWVERDGRTIIGGADASDRYLTMI